MLRFLIFEALFLSVSAYALIRGGAAERIAAATFVIASILTVLALPPLLHRFRHLESGVLVVDAAVLAVMVALAIRTERFWPIWMSALQLAEVLQHLAMLLKLQVSPIAYASASGLWSYPMLVLLAVATWRHQRRLKRTGTDRCWRSC